MTTVDDLKVFLMTSQLIEHNLDRLEREYQIDLGRVQSESDTTDDDYYPQIEHAIRAEAHAMAPHYEMFYSLERTIRALISDSLAAAHGDDWWDRINPKIKADCEGRLQREVDAGVTPRSAEPLDFSTFGELSELIKGDWDVFGALFRSQKAVERVMASLNTLRGPIAHCSPLADDEVVRLRLAVRDWFRMME